MISCTGEQRRAALESQGALPPLNSPPSSISERLKDAWHLEQMGLFGENVWGICTLKGENISIWSEPLLFIGSEWFLTESTLRFVNLWRAAQAGKVSS